MRKRNVLVATFLALALVASACGGDTADPAPTDDPNGGTTPQDPGDAADPNAVVDETFTYVRHVGAVNFDPHKTPCGCDEVPLTPVYDTLLRLSPGAEPIPGVATAWTFAEGDLALDLEIRDDVVFHDGTPLDADVVKLNLDRVREEGEGRVSGQLVRVESVEVTGPYTLRLVLSEPDAALPARLATEPGMLVNPNHFDDPDLSTMPAGSGPFRVVDHRPGDRVLYERFADYWDPEVARVERLEIRVLADASARLNALLTGEAHAAKLLSTALFQQAADNPELVAEPKQMLSFEALYMNRTRSELGDVRVRQAIMHAIDRRGLVQGILGGLGDPVVQPFPAGYWGYNPDIDLDYYPLDLDRARELLAEAGLSDGFSFEAVYPAYNEPLASAVQAQLAEVGITMSIRAVEPAAIADLFFNQQQGDAMLSTVSGHPDPAQLFRHRYTPEGPGNPGGHTTDRFMELYNQVLATTDPDARQQVVHEAVQEILDEVLEVPLYSVGSFLGPVVTQRVDKGTDRFGIGLWGSHLQRAAFKSQ